MSCAPALVIFLVCFNMYLVRSGHTEAEMEGHWGIWCIFTASSALIVEAVLVVFIAVLEGVQPQDSAGAHLDPNSIAVSTPPTGTNRAAYTRHPWLRMITVLIVFIGTLGTVGMFASIWFVPALKENPLIIDHGRPSEIAVDVSKEVRCSIAMLAVFLFVNFAWRIWALFTVPKYIIALALDAAGIAPMFAVLFVALRGRGVELAGKTGTTPSWIVDVMDLTVGIMVGLIAWLFLLPFVAELRDKMHIDMESTAEIIEDRSRASQDFEDRAKTLYAGKSRAGWRQVGRIFVILGRNVLLLVLFGCTSLIVLGFFFMTRKSCTPEAAPAL